MVDRTNRWTQFCTVTVFAACLHAGTTSCVCAQDSNNEALSHYRAGQQAQATGSYPTAVKEFQRVIQWMPQSAEAYASLGLAYNAEDQFADSARALERARKLKPELPGVSLYLGIDLVKLNRPGDAVLPLRKAVQLEPTNKQPRLWLAAALTEAGQLTEAIGTLQKAEIAFPSDAEILFQLGERYKEAAETEIGHILVAASGLPLVHQAYGDIYKDEQVWPKAAGHYARALAEDPTWVGAHLGLGEIALHQSRYDDAEREFHLELENDRNSAQAEAKLAEIFLLRGQAGDALATLQQAIKISPTQAAFGIGLPPEQSPIGSQPDEIVLGQLSRCLPDLQSSHPSAARDLALAFVYSRIGENQDYRPYWDAFRQASNSESSGNTYLTALDDFYRGELKSAEAHLNAWLKNHPDDLRAEYLLAQVHRRQALSTLSQLLAYAPESPSARMLLADSYENAENYEKAIAEYRIVENAAPELPGIHFALGHLLAETGRPDEAAEEFSAELRFNPNHARANAELGLILVQKEELDKGITYLKRAIVLSPELWDAHRLLGEAYSRRQEFVLAQQELQKAVSHDANGAAYFELGRVYKALGQSDRSKAMFARAQQIKADKIADEHTLVGLPEPSER